MPAGGSTATRWRRRVPHSSTDRATARSMAVAVWRRRGDGVIATMPAGVLRVTRCWSRMVVWSAMTRRRVWSAESRYRRGDGARRITLPRWPRCRAGGNLRGRTIPEHDESPRQHEADGGVRWSLVGPHALIGGSGAGTVGRTIGPLAWSCRAVRPIHETWAACPAYHRGTGATGLLMIRCPLGGI